MRETALNFQGSIFRRGVERKLITSAQLVGKRDYRQGLGRCEVGGRQKKATRNEVALAYRIEFQWYARFTQRRQVAEYRSPANSALFCQPVSVLTLTRLQRLQ